ncbi:hypothetical protein F4819DRAFT_489738 [Hypoxylon fuscum]|nr:hypothetical protein F4819DRAFT_489738 [Hypoxylon fuscum]
MSDYNALKVPELKKLLQEKSLPVTGNKADLIARLQEHEKPKNAAPVAEAEDEIDYSDDDIPATTAKPAEPTESAKPAEPAEPTPAPADEKAAEPVAPVKDVPESAPEAAPEAATTAEKPAEAATEEEAKEEAPKPDFSAHLPASKADEEARKRAERAKRFGIVENEEEKKKVERVEKFGVDQSSLAKSLDSALPEKRAPKRGREGANADGERGAKRQNQNRTQNQNDNSGGRQRGRGRFRGGSRQGGPPRKEGNQGGARGKPNTFNDPTEKAKAEARAKRFAATS